MIHNVQNVEAIIENQLIVYVRLDIMTMNFMKIVKNVHVMNAHLKIIV